MRGPRPSGPARLTGSPSGGRMSGRAWGGPLRRAAALPSSPSPSALASLGSALAFALVFAGADLAAGASSAGAGAAAPLPNARTASSSSTLDAATFTSRPALRRTSRASLLEIPRSFAISWTRFLAIRELSLWSPVGLLPPPERPVRALFPRRGYRRTPDGCTRRRPAPPSGQRGLLGPRRPRHAPAATARAWAASGDS